MNINKNITNFIECYISNIPYNPNENEMNLSTTRFKNHCFFIPVHVLCDFRFFKLLVFFTVRWYRKRYGKEIAVLQGYTFCPCRRYKTTDEYRCSMKRTCRGRFVITKDRQFVKSCNLKHNHPPPKFVIRNDVFIRI